MNKKVKNRKLS